MTTLTPSDAETSPGLRSRLTARPRTSTVVFAAMIAAVVVWGVTTAGFFTVDNGKAILSSMAFVGIVAVGMTFIMISGALVSLSLGLTLAVSGMLFMALLHLGAVPAIVLTCLFGVVITAAQGALISGFDANPIVLTIAAGAIQTGIAFGITGGNQILASGEGYTALRSTPLGIPMAVFVLLAVAVVAEIIMRRTGFGLQMRLLGTNRAAAFAAGLPLMRIGAITFGIAGLCTAIAGIMFSALFGYANFNFEGTFTFDAIAATLVGGILVTGGQGAIWRTVLGAFIIAAVSDLMLLNDASDGLRVMVQGILLTGVLLAVYIQSQKKA